MTRQPPLHDRVRAANLNRHFLVSPWNPRGTHSLLVCCFERGEVFSRARLAIRRAKCFFWRARVRAEDTRFAARETLLRTHPPESSTRLFEHGGSISRRARRGGQDEQRRRSRDECNEKAARWWCARTRFQMPKTRPRAPRSAVVARRRSIRGAARIDPRTERWLGPRDGSDARGADLERRHARGGGGFSSALLGRRGQSLRRGRARHARVLGPRGGGGWTTNERVTRVADVDTSALVDACVAGS